MVRKKILFGSTLGLFGLLGVLSLYIKADHARDLVDPDRARREGRPIPVRTAQVSETQLDQVIGATGTTTPSEIGIIRIGPSKSLNINSPVSDILVKAVHVHDGDEVHKGQLLFELDDDYLGRIVKQKEVALATAKANLDLAKQAVPLNERIRQLDMTTAQTGLKFHSEDMDNRKKLVDFLEKLYREKAANIVDYYEYQSKYAQTRFDKATSTGQLQRAKDTLSLGQLTDQRDLAVALNNYESAKIDLELAQRDLERAQIKSPLDGFVNKVEVVAGVTVGVNNTLTQVFKLDPIHVRLDFPQDQIGDLEVGQKAEVVLDCCPGETFEGKVARILPQANAELRVLPVIVELKNAENAIKAGISGYARVHRSRKTLSVPPTAVLRQGGKSMVFRVEEGRARLREVRAGRLLQTAALEIRSGLAVGDEVVIFHNFYRDVGNLASDNAYLQDNDLVDVEWRKWARRD